MKIDKLTEAMARENAWKVKWMIDDYFKLLTDDGEVFEFMTLFTYDSEETGKTYIAFTDGVPDSNGVIGVQASIFEDGRILPITTDFEWDIMEIVLETIKEEAARRFRDSKLKAEPEEDFPF